MSDNSRGVGDRLAAEAEHAERAEQAIDDHAPLPKGTRVTRGHGRSRTLQVRLNSDEYARVENLAETQGLPVSTVARSLLLSGLAPEDSIDAMFDRIIRDMTTVRARWK